MDDEAKKIILARRARFIAAALASVGMVHGCGGKSVSEEEGNQHPTGGTSGTNTGGVNTGGFGASACLSIAGGYGGTQPTGGYGGVQPTGGVGGSPQPCLGMEVGGTGGFAGSAGTGGEAAAGAGGEGGESETGGSAGSGGGAGGAGSGGGGFGAVPCLVPPS